VPLALLSLVYASPPLVHLLQCRPIVQYIFSLWAKSDITILGGAQPAKPVWYGCNYLSSVPAHIVQHILRTVTDAIDRAAHHYGRRQTTRQSSRGRQRRSPTSFNNRGLRKSRLHTYRPTSWASSRSTNRGKPKEQQTKFACHPAVDD